MRLREVDILGLLKHPHIVTLRYFSLRTDSWLLYFEEAGAFTLSQHIAICGPASELARYPQSWSVDIWNCMARNYAREIGSALRYCHLNCVNHNNLQAETIMITPAGRVKITGFLAAGWSSDDQCFDTFAYGTILWHMLCGTVPWLATEAWHRHLRGIDAALSKPPHLPPCTVISCSKYSRS